MTENVQHNGFLNILKSVYALKESEYISIQRFGAGYSGNLENVANNNELIEHAKNIIDSKKPGYHLLVGGEANFPDDKLKGKFDLFYNIISIRIEAVTDELERKISEILSNSFKEELDLSFVLSSLLNFFESVKNK